MISIVNSLSDCMQGTYGWSHAGFRDRSVSVRKSRHKMIRSTDMKRLGAGPAFPDPTRYSLGWAHVPTPIREFKLPTRSCQKLVQASQIFPFRYDVR
jgi:hypothetical protein